jgi:beta-phosphoglucomutase-like phosphatase (HAD superfamily)
VINRDRCDAVLLDLDGVITDTANLHAACWKQMFDEYLEKRATQRDEAFRPFDIATDYRLYVDGKPRFDGIRAFLASRGIQLVEGNPADPAHAETVCSLGNRKNDLINKIIEDVGRSLMREASDSSISSAIAGSKSPLSPGVRIARPS